MKITLGEIVIWLIVGGLAGSLVGMLVTRKRAGFGRWANLGIGAIGALIGGAIFHVLNIDLGLGDLAVSFEDLISACLGALIFLLLLRLVRRRRKSET